MDPDEMRREFLLAAIQDTQGSIHANDAKSSGGLIVHGLLFTGLVGITANIGGVYADAADCARGVGAALLLLTAGCFLMSVWQMIAGLRPCTAKVAEDLPKSSFFLLPYDLADRKLPPGGLWIPHSRANLKSTGRTQLDNARERLLALQCDRHIVDEYAAELIKLSEVRYAASRRTGIGFTWLGVALATTALYLLLIALVAADASSSLRRPALASPALHWTLTPAGSQPVRLSGSGQVRVPGAHERLRIRLLADGEELARLRLRVDGIVRCGRGRAAFGPSVVSMSRPRDDRLVIDELVTPARACAGGVPRRARLVLMATVDGRGFAGSARVVVRG